MSSINHSHAKSRVFATSIFAQVRCTVVVTITLCPLVLKQEILTVSYCEYASLSFVPPTWMYLCVLECKYSGLVLEPNPLCLTCTMDPRHGEMCGETSPSLCALHFHICIGSSSQFVGWTGEAWFGYRPGEWLAVAALKWDQFWCIT